MTDEPALPTLDVLPPVMIDGATQEDVLRVRSTSDVQGLASAIAHAIYEGRRPVMRAIGASAVNQAVKATCIARGYAAQCGYDLCFRTGFENIYLEREQKELSAIRIEVLPRA